MSDLLLPLVLSLATGLVVGWLAVHAARGYAQRTAKRRGIAGFVSCACGQSPAGGQPGHLAVDGGPRDLGLRGRRLHGSQRLACEHRGDPGRGGVLFTSAIPLAETVAATHEIDPEGRWLMAAGVLIYSDVGEKLIVDAPRLGRVAEWPTSWTPGLDAGDVSAALSPTRPPMTLTGTTLAVTGDNRLSGDADAVGIGIEMETAAGEKQTAFVGPYGQGTSTAVTRVPFCADGCSVRAMSFGSSAASAADAVGSFEIAAVSVDDHPATALLDDGAWQPVEQVGDEQRPTAVPAVDAWTAVGGHRHIRRVRPGADPSGRCADGTAGADGPECTDDGPGEIRRCRAAEVRLQRRPALCGLSPRPTRCPFLGPSGLMIDYTMFTRDNLISDVQTQVYVLARSDTPPSVFDALAGRGISTRVSLSETKSVLDQDAYALSLNLYLVAAFAAIGLAVAGLVVTLMVQMPDRRRDSASLRVVGVRRRHVMRAVFAEICAVLGVAGPGGDRGRGTVAVPGRAQRDARTRR
ncbi:MAG: FtsX-like permease family protein [Nocardioidaceae bacterium]